MPTPPDHSEQDANRPGTPGSASTPQGELGYVGPLPPTLEPPGLEPEDSDSEEHTEVDPAQPIAEVPLDDPANPLHLNFKITIPVNDSDEGE
ncbi:MAG: hypothetical protein U1A78_11925 [Polyangia bacterium]